MYVQGSCSLEPVYHRSTRCQHCKKNCIEKCSFSLIKIKYETSNRTRLKLLCNWKILFRANAFQPSCFSFFVNRNKVPNEKKTFSFICTIQYWSLASVQSPSWLTPSCNSLLPHRELRGAVLRLNPLPLQWWCRCTDMHSSPPPLLFPLIVSSTQWTRLKRISTDYKQRANCD